MNLNPFSQRYNRIPNLNTSIRAQHKHEPTMRAVKVNGQITEVKQLKTKANSMMGDHLGSMYFVFFTWAIISRHL